MNSEEKWYPTVGDKFTISVNKRTKDSSCTNTIWECCCVNDLHVVFEHPEYGLELLLKSEYDFAPMDCPTKPEKEESWEPKRYSPQWNIGSAGEVDISNISCNRYRRHGNEWPTKELAEKARDMNKRNQLILQAKHEIGAEDGKWAIAYSRAEEEWGVRVVSASANPELGFAIKRQAEQVMKMVERSLSQ